MLCQQLNLTVDRAAGHRCDQSVIGDAVRRHDLERESCHTTTALLLLGLGQNIINGAGKQEAAFGDAVTLAVQDHLKAADGFLQRHILTGHTGKLLCHMEGLGQEALHLTARATVILSSSDSSSIPIMAMMSCSSL